MKKLLLFMSLSLMGLPSNINAQSEPFIGQIMFVPYNFAPQGWHNCDGSLLKIADYESLFSLIGTTYGGNGQTTFAVPDARGRVIISQGTGAGLSSRTIGERIGSEYVTLTVGQIPSHTHLINASTQEGNISSPSGGVLANTKVLDKEYSKTSTSTTNNSTTTEDTLHSTTVTVTGGNQPHLNMMPSTTLKCIISLYGIFPSQN